MSKDTDKAKVIKLLNAGRASELTAITTNWRTPTTANWPSR